MRRRVRGARLVDREAILVPILLAALLLPVLLLGALDPILEVQ